MIDSEKMGEIVKLSGINEFAEAVAKLLQNVSYDYGKGILKAVNMHS